MTEIRNLPTAQIVAGNNDRKVFDRHGLEDLAASIQENGLAQPITVRPFAYLCPYCLSPADDMGPEYADQPNGHRWYKCTSPRCLSKSTTRSVSGR